MQDIKGVLGTGTFGKVKLVQVVSQTKLRVCVCVLLLLLLLFLLFF